MEDSLWEQNHIVNTARELNKTHHPIVVEDPHNFRIKDSLRINSSINPVLEVNEKILSL